MRNAATSRLRKGILLGLAACSGGQAAVDETIAGCAANEVKDERILCLERALREMAGGDAMPAASADDGEGTQPPGERTAQPPTIPHPLSTEAEERGHDQSGPVTEKLARQRDETDSHVDSLGSEQVARRRGDDGGGQEAPVSATVIAFDFVGYRRLLVELDNGQIWRQTNGDRANVTRELRNEQTFDVELRRTGLGGYRMYLGPLDRTIRVERLK